MERFLITGLPRSRTAWWAIVCNTRSSICLHEPTPHVSSFEELEALWHAPSGMAAGVSDSAVVLQIGRILRELKPRTLIVERDPEESIQSFEIYWGRPVNKLVRTWLLAMQGELERHKNDPLVKTVRYNELDDLKTVQRCFEWLLPKSVLPDFDLLMRMNVQVRLDYSQELAAKFHNGWHLV